MRLHLVLVFFVLLHVQLVKTEDVASTEASDQDLSTVEAESEQFEDDLPYESKLSPRERIVLENEERWQRTLEQFEKQESEEDIQPTPGHEMEEKDSEQGENENNFPQGEDNDYDEYPATQGRLDEHGSQPTDEEETLPVIPGVTDVELVAFNPEYANEEILDKIIDWSYDQVAGMSRYRDNFIHVEDLYQFLLKTLNPLDEEIDAEDEQILEEAVTELRKQQGLVDDEQIVYRGFIARGMPLRFLQSLAHEMHQTVQTRRLQARAGRDEL
ncbi:hypothetical protein V7S43_003239 [Phytophthora oleae]|uniref:RxLR effector protein n=1 Tax=Phytophthora oleae TaxID=2107226 RepID=A0ABD3FX14_9STRA